MKTYDGTVKITQKHIDTGVCGDPINCAVALMLKDYFCSDIKISVSHHSAYEVKGWLPDKKSPKRRGLKLVQFDQSLSKFIHDFDKDRDSVKPTTIGIQHTDIGFLKMEIINNDNEETSPHN